MTATKKVGMWHFFSLCHVDLVILHIPSICVDSLHNIQGHSRGNLHDDVRDAVRAAMHILKVLVVL